MLHCTLSDSNIICFIFIDESKICIWHSVCVLQRIFLSQFRSDIFKGVYSSQAFNLHSCYQNLTSFFFLAFWHFSCHSFCFNCICLVERCRQKRHMSASSTASCTLDRLLLYTLLCLFCCCWFCLVCFGFCYLPHFWMPSKQGEQQLRLEYWKSNNPEATAAGCQSERLQTHHDPCNCS